MHELSELIKNAKANLAMRQQENPDTKAPQLPQNSVSRDPAFEMLSLEDSISAFVEDSDLKEMLAAAKRAHDALPLRQTIVVGTATLCPPDAQQAPLRRDYSRPVAWTYARDDAPCDHDFWLGSIREVPMLQSITIGQMRRIGGSQKHWRQAMAIVIGKWDGQVRIDRVAMMHKIVAELARTRGPDPRDHPAYRVVYRCERAVAFAGVQDFVSKPA